MIVLSKSNFVDSSCLVVSVYRKCLGERRESQLEADAEALSITRLEGSRWRGGRLWSSKWDLRAWMLVDPETVGA